ncbi:MAG: hypothetical protein E3J78_02320 [Candidatus Cloacimonadota bacterium]|nr:MAG: hypothetical protein E3J78_02320 [Candidatus Cloacimonadota bacterium]
MLADILHKIAVDEAKDGRDYKYAPRPSNSGLERCMRQTVYYGLDYEKKPLAGRMLFVFDDSSWHEELTADWIRKSAYRLHSEQMHVNIPTGLNFLPERICEFEINKKKCGQVIPVENIAGHIDGILTDLTGKDILWEHKAISHFTFGMYRKGDVFPLDNITQTCNYLKGLLLVQSELTDALLLIKNKMTSQYLEYYITYDYNNDTATIIYMMDSIDKVKVELNKEFDNITFQSSNRFANVQECIEKKKIPARQYERSHWRCDYCPYGETCWEGWAEEIESMESDVALSEEFGTLLGHRQEIAMHVSEMTKEKKTLDKEIKDKLKEKGIRQGKVDKYTVELSIVEKKAFSVEASSYEKLTIRLKKEA